MRITNNNRRRPLASVSRNLRVYVAPLTPMLSHRVAAVGASGVGLAIEHECGCAKPTIYGAPVLLTMLRCNQQLEQHERTRA